MPYLRHLQLDNNALFRFPRSCASNGTSFFPRLQKLEFSGNKISTLPENERLCFPSLTELDMSRNHIDTLVKDMFGEKRFPQLRELSLEGIQHIRIIKRFAFRNPSLQMINLMFNNIHFNTAQVDSDCFAGSQGLEILNLSNNIFFGVSVTKFRQLFGPLQNLQKLYLSSCSVKRITGDTFIGLTNLSVLAMSRNRIRNLPDSIFDSLISLKSLILGPGSRRVSKLCSYRHE